MAEEKTTAGDWAKATPALEVGQLVKLPSGGPAMTVTHIAEATGACEVSVAWFDGDAHPGLGSGGGSHRESFPRAALQAQKTEAQKEEERKAAAEKKVP